MSVLTPRQALALYIRNDARNVRDTADLHPSGETLPRVISDCARRLFEAAELGDRELKRRAEDNLRAALRWEGRRRVFGEER